MLLSHSYIRCVQDEDTCGSSLPGDSITLCKSHCNNDALVTPPILCIIFGFFKRWQCNVIQYQNQSNHVMLLHAKVIGPRSAPIDNKGNKPSFPEENGPISATILNN